MTKKREFVGIEYAIERWTWLFRDGWNTLLDKKKKVKNFWKEYLKETELDKQRA